jgi:hypothetical protein
MELLETQDPEKRKLIETSDRHKRELEKEVNEIAARTERTLTNALIIGGSLAVTYYIITRFTGSKSKSKKKKQKNRISQEADEDEAEDAELVMSAAPSFISEIGTKVMNQATMILLDIAREKLNEYLKSRKGGNENS